VNFHSPFFLFLVIFLRFGLHGNYTYLLDISEFVPHPDIHFFEGNMFRSFRRKDMYRIFSVTFSFYCVGRGNSDS